MLGLILASLGIFAADSIAALIVACIVIWITYKLGKKAVNVLLDRTPDNTFNRIDRVLQTVKEISYYHDLKVRESGAETFVELNIHVHSGLTIEQAHKITHLVEDKIKAVIDRCDVYIHTQPDEDSV